MTTFDAVLQAPQARRALNVAAALGGGALAFVFGVGLAALASHFGDVSPAVFVAVPFAPLLALAVLAAPTIAVIAVFATFPVGAVEVPTGVIPLQTVEAAVLAIVTVVVLRRLGRGQIPLPWSPPLYWALALLAWSMIALQSAIDETLALKQVGALIGGIIFCASVLAACRHMDDLRIILGAFVAVTAGIAVASFAGGVRLQASVYGAQQVRGRLQGAFDHPNQLGALCAMGVAVAVGMTFGSRTRFGRIASGISGALIFTALLFTLSRGAWIGTALAMLFLLVSLKEVRRALAVLLVPGLLAAAIVAPLVPAGETEIKVVGERARAITELSPYDDRKSIYAEAWREIKANPTNGVGPGGFPLSSARAGSRNSTVAVAHAHNLALTWGAEAGIPAVIFILGLACALALSARRAGRAFRQTGRLQDRAIVMGLAAALLAILGQGMFDYVFRNAVAHIALWSLVGALLVCRREGQRALRAR